MKVILLFDSDKLENVYREYHLDEKLRIAFCHP